MTKIAQLAVSYAVGMRSVQHHGGSSPTTWWQATLGQPGSHLRSDVEAYAEYHEFSTSPVGRREAPGPRTVLIVELAGPLMAAGAVDDGRMRPVSAFIGCPGRGSALTWHNGVQHCLEARLSPSGAGRLLGSMWDMAGRIVPIEALWGRAALLFVERLIAARSWRERFDLLDVMLTEQMADRPETEPEILHAWARLEAAAGNVAIADLAAETGWSRARLADRFRSATGLSPKGAGSVIRFNRAASLATSSNCSLASVAAECGYYDQAHLDRDFRLFAGCTPTQWRQTQLTGLVGATSD